MFRSENVLVGLVALGLVPWIGWTILRGVRERRLPVGRAYVRREERAAPFYLLLVMYVCAMVGAALIAIDLIFNLSLRDFL